MIQLNDVSPWSHFKRTPENGGSENHLTLVQTAEFSKQHLSNAE